MDNILTLSWRSFVQKFGFHRRNLSLPPLMACCDREKRLYSTHESYQALMKAINLVYNEYKQENFDLSAVSDEVLVQLLRDNEVLRRLATLFMHSRPPDQKFDATLELLTLRLMAIWERVLVVPPKPTLKGDGLVVSLVVPCHKETVSSIRETLTLAMKHARNLEQVQVVLVDTGTCNQSLSTLDNPGFGDMTVVVYTQGGGRGPTLNAGAQASSAPLLLFCHADVQLPDGWDTTVRTTLQRDGVSVAAFSFAVGIPRPWGIIIIEWCVAWRCWGRRPLPYGDQCLAMHSDHFSYVGGFPHQAFMEDYDFVNMFRQRSRILGASKERVVMMEGPPALISSRRWCRHGVAYVTWRNYWAIRMHRRGLSISEIYKAYYDTSAGTTGKSTWNRWRRGSRQSLATTTAMD